MPAGFLAHVVFGVPLLVARPGPMWLDVIALAGVARTAAAVAVAVAVTVAVAAGTTQRSLRQQMRPPQLQSRAQRTSVWPFTGLRPVAALTVGGMPPPSRSTRRYVLGPCSVSFRQDCCGPPRSAA
jgi:hypothetical protein